MNEQVFTTGPNPIFMSKVGLMRKLPPSLLCDCVEISTSRLD